MKNTAFLLRSFLLMFFLIISMYLAPYFFNSRISETHAQTVIEITTLEDLYAIQNNLAGDYVLMNNLDFQNDSDYENIDNKTAWTTGEGWVPIGISETPFTGSLDGGGYEIKNLFINRSADYQGLFGYNFGTIQNLIITNMDITGGDIVGGLIGDTEGLVSNCYSTGSVSGTSYIGGLIGSNDGTVINCYSTGSVSATVANAGGLAGSNSGEISGCHSTGSVSGMTSIGGLVGWNNFQITNSYSSSSVISEGDSAGGLVGYSFEGTISSCYSTGSVSGITSVGGLIGSSDGTVINCYSTGSVSGTSAWVGGLIGDISASTGSIENSYSISFISGPGPVGGIVSASNGSVTNSFWDLQTSGIDVSDGGTGKSTVEMNSLSTFNDTWDILGISSFDSNDTSIWYINDGSDYPRLFWQYSAPAEDTNEPEVSPEGNTLPQTGNLKSKALIITGLLIQFFGLVIYKLPNLEIMKEKIEKEKREKFEKRFK